MHRLPIRVASLGLLLLGACGQSASERRAASQVAGGESSEFSGGDAPLGFCPVEVSRTPLALDSDEVAGWIALVEGHHELSLRWRREFPSDGIRGFEERTVLSLDATPTAAEEVVCSNGDSGGYEVEGLEGRHLRRFDFAVELSTADGAIHGASPLRFFPLRDVDGPGERLMLGGAVLPFEELAGTLELGVDPELASDTQTLQLDFSFDQQGVTGSVTPWVSLPGPVLGDDTPRWAPVRGVFPAPDEGCEFGSSVPLDTRLDVLDGSPRAAYEAARARLPVGPIAAAWEDPAQAPGSFTQTEVTLSAGMPTRACRVGADIQVYASLHIESADGRIAAEPSIIASVSRVGTFQMAGGPTWTPSAEFVASSGVKDLDLSLADYGGLSVNQTFDADEAGEALEGELDVVKWESDFARAASPVLRWCAGTECDRYWCLLTSTDGGASCL
jgi:hypothetical protein